MVLKLTFTNLIKMYKNSEQITTLTTKLHTFSLYSNQSIILIFQFGNSTINLYRIIIVCLI